RRAVFPDLFESCHNVLHIANRGRRTHDECPQRRLRAESLGDRTEPFRVGHRASVEMAREWATLLAVSQSFLKQRIVVERPGIAGAYRDTLGQQGFDEARSRRAGLSLIIIHPEYVIDVIDLWRFQR